MNELINVQSSLLSETEEGKAWCIKALHPADPVVQVQGIPDKNATPSVMMNYQTRVDLGTPDEESDTWNLDFALLPHPTHFGYVRKYISDYVAATIELSNIANSQIPGGGGATMWDNFIATYERWRLCYMSASVYLNASATTDSGMVVAASVPSVPKYYYCSPTIIGVDQPSTMMPPIMSFQTTDVPSYEYIQAMPNMYSGNLRDGVYLPLKLSHDFDRWYGQDDVVYTAQSNDAPTIKWRSSAPVVSPPCYPLPDVVPFTAISGSDAVAITGHPTVKMCNNNIGHICMRGINKNATITIVIRCGFQFQVNPRSLIAPQMKVSPAYDALALAEYYRVARRLKDAYPVSYNDLGKLWKVIKAAIDASHPALNMLMPGLGTGTVMATKGIDATVSAIKRAIEAKKNKSKKKKNIIIKQITEQSSALDKQDMADRLKQLRITRK